jgi:hypothetical protein
MRIELPQPTDRLCSFRASDGARETLGFRARQRGLFHMEHNKNKSAARKVRSSFHSCEKRPSSGKPWRIHPLRRRTATWIASSLALLAITETRRPGGFVIPAPWPRGGGRAAPARYSHWAGPRP